MPRADPTGRWVGVLLKLGIPKELLNKRNQPCPFCGGKDRFRFTDGHGRGLWVCSQCSSGNGWQLLQRYHGWDFKTADERVSEAIEGAPVSHEEPDEDKLETRRKEMWREARPVSVGDPVDLYLRSRGLGMAEYPKSLRYHERTCAMVAAVMIGTKGVQLHRTFLTKEGRKADVVPNRKMMPGRLPKGASIPLSWPPPAPAILGIAEGIETALAAGLIHGLNVWAAISSHGLETWNPPASVRVCWVFGDNDLKYGGQKAAYVLAHRLAVQGVTVRVLIPGEPGTDWNDVLLSGARTNAPDERAGNSLLAH